MSKSILQDWVVELGLRHQGVLLTAVRGPDDTPRECPSKALTRAYRAEILNAHCGDPLKAKSFIEKVADSELIERMHSVLKDHDALPHHWIMHMIHAAEILGYKGPTGHHDTQVWTWFYRQFCRKLHMTPETEAEMDARLDADETTFAKQQAG